MAAQQWQDAEGTQMRTKSVARKTATRMGGFFCALWLLVLAQWPICSREGVQRSMAGRSAIRPFEAEERLSSSGAGARCTRSLCALRQGHAAVRSISKADRWPPQRILSWLCDRTMAPGQRLQVGCGWPARLSGWRLEPSRPGPCNKPMVERSRRRTGRSHGYGQQACRCC